jgi:iron complex transport system permease protein
MGGLDSRTWDHVLLLLPVFIPVFFLLVVLSRPLNLFSLGEEGAHSLGVNVELTKRVLLVASALVTGVAVSISGSIGFVGLLVPHILRLIIGPDHRYLVPASALGGGIFLVVCDAVGRTIASPYEVKVGVITALLGAPYLFALLIRFKRRMKGGFGEGSENFV